MAGAAEAPEARSAFLFPCASLLTKQFDDTYATDKSVNLSHFLFLAIEKRTYCLLERDFALQPEEEALSTHPAVYFVISTLARAIIAGSSAASPIPFENTTPRLKRLTLPQKEHIEWVLKNGVSGEVVPPRLRDLRFVSPYVLDSKLLLLSSPILVARTTNFRQLPTPPPSILDAVVELPSMKDSDLTSGWALEAASGSPSPGGGDGGVQMQTPASATCPSEVVARRWLSFQRSEERRDVVMEWHDLCFSYIKQEGIKYAIAKQGGPLEGCLFLAKGFLDFVIMNKESTLEYFNLLEDLERRRIPYPGDTILVSHFVLNGIIPAIVDSSVALFPHPE